MYILLKDKPVLYFDFEEMLVEVIEPNLIPWGLRGRIKPLTQTTPKEMATVMSNNVQSIKEWLSNRVLSLNRDNAKQIFALFNISQSNDINTRVSICLRCYGVTVTDSYWVKSDNDKKTWLDVNIRKNHFKEIIDIALNGYYPTITTNPICPELTTKGVFKKAWTRDLETKDLYLLKSDNRPNNINTRCEVLASHVLDCFTNVAHVQYSGRVRNTKDGKLYVNKCKNFVGESYSFVEAKEVIDFCNLHNLNFEEFALRMFGSKFANISVVDYIILNTDRHDNNYGFLMDNDSGMLVDIASLFDFNCALVADVGGWTEKALETYNPMFNSIEYTIKSLAMKMLPYSDIKVDRKHLKDIEKYFKDYKQVYKNVVSRIEFCCK